MARDPVCGMEVEPEEAAAVSEYGGKKYYFCAPGCKERFEADPGKYLGGATEPMSGAKKEGFWARLFKG